jgi:hypothetical protein
MMSCAFSFLCCCCVCCCQVWVLDSQPGTVPLDVDAPTSVGKIIQLIHSIPTPLTNRQELYRWVHCTHKHSMSWLCVASQLHKHLSTHAQHVKCRNLRCRSHMLL